MTEIAVEALRDELRHYLQRAQQGERIIITDQGHSIAVLAPAEESEVSRQARRLVERGGASWSGGKPTGSGHKPRVRGTSASQVVLEDRR